MTYPQCDVDLAVIKELFDGIFGIDNIEFVRIASEEHGDGSLHRHALVMLRQEMEFRSATFGDLCVPCAAGMKTYHGDYRSARSVSNVYRYVSKGKDFISFGTDPMIVGNRKNPLAKVVAAIRSGKTEADIEEEFPELYFMQQKRVAAYCAVVALKARKEATLEWNTKEVSERLERAKERGVLAESSLRVAEWLVGNIGLPRKFKQKQLYLVGPPNYGKTSLINLLSKFGPVYFAPTDEQFFDEFNEGYHRLAVFDEFKGKHEVPFMNQFLEMGMMTIRKKGSQVLRVKNIPTIICSNFRPERAYGKISPEVLVGFMARIELVELTEPIFPILDGIRSAHGLTPEEVV